MSLVSGARARTLVKLVVVIGTLSGCKGGEDSATGGSPAFGSPSPVSPAPGAEVNEVQPTLVVNNVAASGGGTPTYSFQVAADSTFGTVQAADDGIPQGSGGRTSWQVATALGSGRHYWRARARVGSTDGPFSAAAEFTVRAAFISNNPGADRLVVFDPLTSNFTVGARQGGEFTSRGWRVNSPADSIVYDLSTIGGGFIEVDVTNVSDRNATPDPRMFFIMWDPSRGDFSRNPYRVNLQKLDPRSGASRPFRLRWTANGELVEDANSFNDWTPASTYTLRMFWEPEGPIYVAKVQRDGLATLAVEFRRAYNPARHRIELGGAPTGESLEGAVYSNVRIGSGQ